MHQSVTELDRRSSDKHAVANGWDETRRVLEDAELFWITTVRVDGRPHVTPLVAVWLDCNEWDHGLDVVVGRSRASDRRQRPKEARSGVGREVGRALALRGARRQLPEREWERGNPRLRGEARQGIRVRQRHLRPDTTSVLDACTPLLTRHSSHLPGACARRRDHSPGTIRPVS